MQTPPRTPSEAGSEVTDWTEYENLMTEMLYFQHRMMEQYPMWMIRQAFWETLRGDRGYIGSPQYADPIGPPSSPTPANGSRANLSLEQEDLNTGNL